MRTRKPVPDHLRHRIVPAADGFEFQTCYGYVLKAFTTFEDVQAYQERHCPVD